MFFSSTLNLPVSSVEALNETKCTKPSREESPNVLILFCSTQPDFWQSKFRNDDMQSCGIIMAVLLCNFELNLRSLPCMCRWHCHKAAWVTVAESRWDQRQRQTEIRSKKHRSSTKESADWSLQSSWVHWYMLLWHTLTISCEVKTF